MGDKEQTKWGGSYSLKYSYDKSYKNEEQVYIIILTSTTS